MHAKKKQPKPPGGDDNGSRKTPSSFRGLPSRRADSSSSSKKPGTRNDFPQAISSFGPVANKDKQRLESTDNARPPSKQTGARGNPAGGNITEVPKSPEKLEQLRDDLKTAFEEYVQDKHLKCQPSSLEDELIVYAAKLIGQVQMKGGTGKVKEKQQQGEMKSRIGPINAWLDKLKEQIEKETFQPKEIADSKQTETREINTKIKDLCMKLSVKQDEKNKQLRDLTNEFAEELKAETTSKWNLENSSKTIPKSGISEEILHLKACLNEIKTQKQNQKQAVKELIEAINEFQKQSPTKVKVEAKGNKTDTRKNENQQSLSSMLRDAKQQLDTKATVYQREQSAIDQEIKEFGKEIDDLRNFSKVDTANGLNEGSQKNIRDLRIKLKTQKEILKASFPKSSKDVEKLTDEINTIKEKIKELWTIIPNKGKREQKKKQKEANATEMLTVLGTFFDDCQEKMNLHEQERKGIFEELEELRREAADLTENRKDNFKDDLQDGIQKQIRSIRKTLDARKNESSKRLENTQQALEDELSSLENEVLDWDKNIKDQDKKVDPNSPYLVQKTNQIRTTLNKKKKELDNRTTAKIKQDGELRKHTKRLWILAFGTEGDAKSADHGNIGDVLQMLETLTTELEKLDDVSFKIEETCCKIYCHLTGKQPSVKDTAELKTPMNVLRSCFEKLQSCEQEAKLFLAKFSDLETALSVESVAESMLEKCSRMTDSAKRWNAEKMSMHEVIDMCLIHIPIAYASLLDKPYGFLERNIDMKSIEKRFPHWLQEVALAISKIHGCIEENKANFEQKFVKVEIFDSLKKRERSLLDDVTSLKAEKEELLNRLSKVAGAKLTENNPNIADLSDPNRPTKLAEQYSELYDNPWTDAFEVLDKADDKGRIIFLLNILVESYKECKAISANHQMVLKKAMCCPTEGMDPKKEANTKSTSDVKLSSVQSKALTELRKQSVDISVVDVKIYIEKKHKEWFEKDQLKTYTSTCIELCWLMHVQSPPVYMETTLKAGSNFDTNRHKQYTKAGKKIDFLVWPVLLLHEDGSILSKGVAQGK